MMWWALAGFIVFFILGFFVGGVIVRAGIKLVLLQEGYRGLLEHLHIDD